MKFLLAFFTISLLLSPFPSVCQQVNKSLVQWGKQTLPILRWAGITQLDSIRLQSACGEFKEALSSTESLPNSEDKITMFNYIYERQIQLQKDLEALGTLQSELKTARDLDGKRDGESDRYYNQVPILRQIATVQLSLKNYPEAYKIYRQLSQFAIEGMHTSQIRHVAEEQIKAGDPEGAGITLNACALFARIRPEYARSDWCNSAELGKVAIDQAVMGDLSASLENANDMEDINSKANVLKRIALALLGDKRTYGEGLLPSFPDYAPPDASTLHEPIKQTILSIVYKALHVSSDIPDPKQKVETLLQLAKTFSRLGDIQGVQQTLALLPDSEDRFKALKLCVSDVKPISHRTKTGRYSDETSKNGRQKLIEFVKLAEVLPEYLRQHLLHRISIKQFQNRTPQDAIRTISLIQNPACRIAATLNYARSIAWSGRKKEASKLLAAASRDYSPQLNLDPKMRCNCEDIEGVFVDGKALGSNFNFKESVHFTEYVVHDDPGEFDALKSMSDSHERLERLNNLIIRQKYRGNRTGAKRSLALLLRIEGDAVSYSSLQKDFDLFDDDNKLMDVIAHFKTAEERADGFLKLALLQLKRNDFNRARFSLRRALNEALSDQQTHNDHIDEIANGLYAVKDYDNYQKALSALVMQARLLPKDYERQRVILMYAGLQARHGDPNVALATYESLIPEEYPNGINSERLTQIAIAQAETGDLVHATQTLHLAIGSASSLLDKSKRAAQIGYIAASIAFKVSQKESGGGGFSGYPGGCSF